MLLGPPVRGHIYGHGEVPPLGAFWVSATFGQVDADHLTPHQGIDIGNKTCGFDILAMEDGVWKEAFQDAGNGAFVARYELVKDTSIRLGIAHMPDLSGIQLGQGFKKGDLISHCGSSGASSCHLHQGAAKLVNGVWVEFDWWPLLDQTGEDMTPIPPTKFASVVNKITKVILDGGATLRADRFNSAKALKLYPKGTAFTPLCIADDGDPSPVSKRWYGGLGGTDAGVMFGFLQEGALAPLTDATPPADTTAAYNAGVDAASKQALSAKKG